MEELVVVGFERTLRQVRFVRYVVRVCKSLRRVEVLRDGKVKYNGLWEWEVVRQEYQGFDSRIWSTEGEIGIKKQFLCGRNWFREDVEVIVVERILSILATWLSYRAISQCSTTVSLACYRRGTHLRATELDLFVSLILTNRGKLNALLVRYEHTVCALTDSITNVLEATDELVGNECQRVKRFDIEFFAMNGTYHVECVHRLVDTDIVKWGVEELDVVVKLV
uniref:Uncharacterized protein n=1 Tax=Leersia perrieri TaxID=77586 RepID=A0A0D9W412_9ORYZ